MYCITLFFFLHENKDSHKRETLTVDFVTIYYENIALKDVKSLTYSSNETEGLSQLTLKQLE